MRGASIARRRFSELNPQTPPAICQIEFHPYSLPAYMPTLLPLLAKHHIAIGAYAPLMSLARHPDGPVDEVVRSIAQERGLGETEAQVLLQWAQQVSGGQVITCVCLPSSRS